MHRDAVVAGKDVTKSERHTSWSAAELKPAGHKDDIIAGKDVKASDVTPMEGQAS